MFDINLLNSQELRFFNQAVGHSYKAGKAFWSSTKNKEKAALNSSINSVLVLLYRRGITASFADIYAHVTGRSRALLTSHPSYSYGGVYYPAPPITYYNDFNDPLLPALAITSAIELTMLANEEARFSPDVIVVDTSDNYVPGFDYSTFDAGPVGFGGDTVVNETVVNNYGDTSFDGSGAGAAEAAAVGAEATAADTSFDSVDPAPSSGSDWGSGSDSGFSSGSDSGFSSGSDSGFSSGSDSGFGGGDSGFSGGSDFGGSDSGSSGGW